MTKEELVAQLKCRASAAERAVREFARVLTERPAYELSWSSGTFRAAAEFDVFTFVLEALDGKATPESVRAFAEDEVRKRTLHRSRSTSVTCDLMEQEKGRAWARLIDILSR